MSSASPHRGRRDNGLDAAEYAAAGDVDPRVGEHLLDVLALQGIAAYLQPAIDLNPVTRNTTMPPRPTDRLFVDRTHLRTAREHLAQLAEPHPASSSPAGTDDRGQQLDEAWAEIVARYDIEVDATAGGWPDAENLADDHGARTEEQIEQPGAQDQAQDRDPPDAPDDDEGYTPPPPPPLPRLSKYAASAVLGIVAGFIVFLKPGLLPIDPDVTMLVGTGAVLAGAAALVWRLRPGDEEDDYDPDDGARV